MNLALWTKRLYRVPREKLVLWLTQKRPRSEKALILIERQISPRVERLPATWSPRERHRAGEKLNEGGDKMSALRHGYARAYSSILGRLPENGALLEVGVFIGSSLGLWSLALPSWKLFGLDIELGRWESNQERLKHLGCFSRAVPTCILFDAYDPDTNKLLEAMQASKTSDLDLIIDDGPHTDEAILTTFTALFPLLNPNGFYVVEDNLSVRKGLTRLAINFGAHLRRQGDLLVVSKLEV